MSLREELDAVLRARGMSGAHVIADTIFKAVREKRVLVGPLIKILDCTLHEGQWLISDRLSGPEKSTALIWLACAELQIPAELRDRLIEEFTRYCNGHPPGVWDEANDIFTAYLSH